MATEISERDKTSMDKRKMVANIAKAMGIDIDPDVYAAEVIRSGDKIILPDGASIPDVIKSLQAKYDEERQKVSVNTQIPVPPWDGAIALQKAIRQELGLDAIANEIPGSWFSPEQPPQEIEVEYELGKTMTVRWGQFTLASMDGATVVTGITRDDTTGEFVFACKITTLRRWQAKARKILDVMRDFAAKESIHKGKAFSITFTDADGDQIPIPTPKFFPFNKQKPIFREELERGIERNVFTPIRHAQDLQGMLKRGILFAGKYGVGKTMMAAYIAEFATQYGWTFIYGKKAEELPQLLRYAQKFQPAVVFVEDVDRIAGTERTKDVNDLLNQLDGVDSKSAQLMTILTSNHSKRINKAMRRPGRIDLILQVLSPDQSTIQRMVRSFVGDGLEPDTDLSGIAEVLDGFAPAYVKEACDRSRLESLRRTGNIAALINGDDLAVVAQEVKTERDLFIGADDEEDDEDAPKKNANALGDAFGAAATALKKAGAKEMVK